MKHSKKSLFITTIMMVVLLVAALSTATYAWYTSSNTVNTTITEVNSAESTGANISIGWKDNTPAGVASMEFADAPGDYHPMVPLAGTFTNDTEFYTAVMSYGKLSQHVATPAYIGSNPDDGGTTFYVVNYARVNTNVKFEANVTGENAARLRVAVFNATTGALVFTNTAYYTGTINATVPTKYDLVSTPPTDWADAFGTAKYSSATGEYVQIPAVAPTFVPNMYYLGDGSVALQEGEEPGDWAANYANYSTDRYIKVPVEGVAPAFDTIGTVYQVTPAVPEHMTTSTERVAAVAPNTLIGASGDGVTGVAQGFVVKAWFDGPSQVDAYGGMSAFFTLKVTAANVTP